MSKQKLSKLLKQLEGLLIYPAALGSIYLILIGTLGWQNIPLNWQIANGQIHTILLSGNTGVFTMIIGWGLMLIILMGTIRELFSFAKYIRNKFS